METITIFTDGSSRGNPGPGGWGAIAIYPDSKGTLKVDELGGGEKETTNNRMEIMAVISALENFTDYYSSFLDKKFIIYIDSAYVLNGATKWIRGWKAKNWKTIAKEDVKNRDLWERLADVLEGKSIKWNLIKGHSGTIGNERCDVIATTFADAAIPDLYKGTFAHYTLQNILNIETGVIGNDGSSSSSSSSKSRSKLPAYSYVSSVDGKVMTHKTWVECEARVKGVSGTRFKKALSKSEEDTIKKEFAK